jgi:hypothetical protein
VDRLIYVVPGAYGKMPVAERYALARLIGRVARGENEREGAVFLVGPGRWGTSMPAMGVPVSFQEIRSISALCEVAVMHENLVPDVSLGTHFFNDLVETDILYLGVFPEREGHALNEGLLRSARNRLAELAPDAAPWAHALQVVSGADIEPGRTLVLSADSVKQTAVCYLE